MSVTATITNIREPKSCNNLVSEFMTFNEDITYNITAGVGNLLVTNSDEYPIYGERSQKVRFLSNLPATFTSSGTLTQSIVPKTGEYCLVWELQKNDVSADVTYTVECFVNGTLTSARTVVGNAYSSSGFVDGQVNTFWTFIDLTAGDEVSFSITAQCDTVDTVIYVDGFGLFYNDKALQAPPFYIPPTNLAQKWQQRYDSSGTNTLTEDAENGNEFIGVSTTNCVSSLIYVTGNFQPTRLNAMFHAVTAFDAKVPAGTDNHIDIIFKVNDVLIQSHSHLLHKPVDEFQEIYNIFEIPVDANFLQYGGEVYLIPRGADVEISNRKTIAIEHTNSY